MTKHIQQLNQTILPWLIIAVCFSFPFGIGAINITIGILFLAWLFSGEWETKYQRIIQNPASTIAIGLFVLYGLGMVYSNVDWHTKSMWWFRYHKLLYIPIVISIITSDRHRNYAINAFLISSIITLTASYLMWGGLITPKDLTQGYIVFTNRIYQSILMAFAMFLMLMKAKNLTGYFRLTWLIFSALVIFNILFLVNGRTGQVLAFVLLALFSYQTWGKRAIIGFSIAISITLTCHQFLPDSRLTVIGKEISSHHANVVETSSDQRIEYYTNTLILIKRHPFLGGGTGSFEQEFSQLATSKHLAIDHLVNPHNQFLLITHELGIVGLFALMAFFTTQWRTASQLKKTSYGTAMKGLIVTMVIGSLFNSLLLDAAEGKFFCVLAGVLLSAYIPKSSSLVADTPNPSISNKN
ncbi:O-antigen ligase family protein [Methyloradius palustris]|uniref:O-antigen ligase family protein n=1 Tax=Methyloradius palustris TaxID=2778876 RepID=UPI001C8C7EBD|nr:O-antigen ligase family protein [Methyloradius palustris]